MTAVRVRRSVDKWYCRTQPSSSSAQWRPLRKRCYSRLRFAAILVVVVPHVNGCAVQRLLHASRFVPKDNERPLPPVCAWHPPWILQQSSSRSETHPLYNHVLTIWHPSRILVATAMAAFLLKVWLAATTFGTESMSLPPAESFGFAPL